MLDELNTRLKALVDIDYESELYKYIERERLGTIVAYNKTQLFKRSIGADGIDLGFYKKATESYDTTKTAGSPYEMFDTGAFYSSIFASVVNNEVIISSRDPKLKDMLETSIYITNDFFGLTEENSKHFINRWVKPYIKNLMRI